MVPAACQAAVVQGPFWIETAQLDFLQLSGVQWLAQKSSQFGAAWAGES